MEQSDSSLGNKKAILEYWSLVEFFSPYILENVLDSKQNYQKIYEVEPERQPLPWINAEIISEDDMATPFAKAFNLYLGLFNIEETKDMACRNLATKRRVSWKSYGDC